jgi:hypothetical protein
MSKRKGEVCFQQGKSWSHHFGMLTPTGEPSNLFKALSDKCWKRAMDIEFDALV